MHTKQKGNVGEAAAILALSRFGYSVFREIGDLARVDLIAMKGNKMFRIQVKAASPIRGAVVLPLVKDGPNYSYRYKKGDVDFFALVDLATLKVAFIPESILDTHNKCCSFRVAPAVNGQENGTREFSDFEKLQDSDAVDLPLPETVNVKERREYLRLPRPNSRKVERPSLDVIEAEVAENGYEAAGRKFGVTGGMVKKWIRFERRLACNSKEAENN